MWGYWINSNSNPDRTCQLKSKFTKQLDQAAVLKQIINRQSSVIKQDAQDREIEFGPYCGKNIVDDPVETDG